MERQEKKTAAAGGDHFVVEDLLNFSNEEAAEDEKDNTGTNGGADGALTTGNSAVSAVGSCNSSFSGDPVSRLVAADAGLSGDLCEPYDDLAELEWLSNFVEDSFSSEDLQKLQLLSGVKSAPGLGSGSSSSETREGEVPAQPSVPFFLPDSSTVPGKARSKRSRAAPCNWSSRLLVLSPNTATSSSDSDSILLSPISVKKCPKPMKKKEAGLNGPALMAASDGRRCLHCATDKTPQWRTGPMGPKTLCNACGVRYKSGRLVPEYRPAASPTFVLSKHSNSHRKVLELRRQKEMQMQHQPFMGPLASYFDGATAGAAAGASADEFLIHHHLGPDFRQLI